MHPDAVRSTPSRTVQRPKGRARPAASRRSIPRQGTNAPFRARRGETKRGAAPWSQDRLGEGPEGTPGAGRSASVGFSLVECLVCCALLGLLLFLSIEGLQRALPAARVNRALREVAALLEWSRWAAVRQGCALRVVVGSDGKSLSVLREEETEEGQKQLVPVRSLDMEAKHPGVVFGAAEGVVRTSGCKPVDPTGVHLRDGLLRFLPTGTPDRCGSLYLIPEQDLPRRADRMRALSILLTTGRVQAWTYDPFGKSECPDAGAWQPL